MKEITSVHNPQVQFLRDLQKAKNRRASGLFLAESMKMVREAIELSLCRTLVVDVKRQADYADLIERAQAAGCEVLLVTSAMRLPGSRAASASSTGQGRITATAPCSTAPMPSPVWWKKC